MKEKNYIKNLVYLVRFVLFCIKYWNHIDIGRKSFVILEGRTIFKFGKGAKLKVNGVLTLGCKSIGYCSRCSTIRIDNNARLEIRGRVELFYNADIILFENSVLEIMDSYINSDSKLRISSEVHIYNHCSISHDFTLLDSDYHQVNGVMKTKPIEIGPNVWIGTRVTVLAGTVIQEGSIIAACSLVNGIVDKNVLAAGIPVKTIKSINSWS